MGSFLCLQGFERNLRPSSIYTADRTPPIARAYYGSPQSLGCLEVPYTVGKAIWPYLRIGTLVAVIG